MKVSLMLEKAIESVFNVLALKSVFNSIFSLGEMIDKLTITFNRTRQAVITGELIEIISGAAAL